MERFREIDLHPDLIAHIREHASRIDNLLESLRETIDRLNEFRTALIAAAVTGKNDVREHISGSRAAFNGVE
jgi:type I restriction enzyme S subunit